METGVFKPVSKKDIIDAIKKLPSNKASISNDIPVSVMKRFAKCYCEKRTNILKDCLEENRFPNLMKVAEKSPVFKKLDNTFNESIIYSQLNDCIENKFSKYFTAFCKSRNT